jgi:DNA-directed RNA polymerase specialized sigma54-like protein
MTSATPRLELRTSQSLVMTQQLQQSIKLLQMTALEVQSFIEGQLESNPFLSQEEEQKRRRKVAPSRLLRRRNGRTMPGLPMAH